MPDSNCPVFDEIEKISPWSPNPLLLANPNSSSQDSQVFSTQRPFVCCSSNPTTKLTKQSWHQPGGGCKQKKPSSSTHVSYLKATPKITTCRNLSLCPYLVVTWPLITFFFQTTKDWKIELTPLVFITESQPINEEFRNVRPVVVLTTSTSKGVKVDSIS